MPSNPEHSIAPRLNNSGPACSEATCSGPALARPADSLARAKLITDKRNLAKHNLAKCVVAKRGLANSASSKSPLASFWVAALIAAAILAALAFSGCSYPQRYDNGLAGPEIPESRYRELILTFERESDFAPLAGRAVSVALTGHGEILVPSRGRGVTDGSGRLKLVISPVAIYDKSALKTGDIVVEYPVDLTVAMVVDGDTFEWDLDARQSFARYQDPLYQGLNREPTKEPLHLTLTIQ